MAALAYLVLNGSESRLAGQTRSFLDSLRVSKELGNDVSQSLQQAAGDGAIALAIALGFPTDAQGQANANALKDLAVEASNALNASASITAVIQRVL